MTPFFSTLFGACVGSFLNVCLSRWKSGGQILSPPSHCPRCRRFIPWHDNIPILSFLFLRGRCRFCRGRISWQYPLVELLTSGLFLASFFRFSAEPFQLLKSFFFVSFMVLFVTADLKWRVLPHPFNNLFALFGFAFLFGGVFPPGKALFVGASSFVVAGFLVFIPNQIYSKGIGGGDIKLVAGLGIWIGFAKVLMVLLASFGMGALFVLAPLLLGKINRKSTVSFGPFLALASLALWFFPEIATAMTNWLRPQLSMG
jgi:leader peptidase (prepilin peptidase) / N-methyltransferase